MAILTADVLREEIRARRIVVTPVLDADQIEEGSVNLRLGCDFIVMKRSEVVALDPRETSTHHIRRVQRLITVPFGGHFVLHPGELVLGAVFEFVAFPENRCGLVLSRSSYGRLGLLVATATYIHPLWRGWLTLELYNYGTVPLQLSAGSSIAQLVVSECSPVQRPADYFIRPKVSHGPEFAALADRPEWSRLERIRSLLQKWPS